MKTSEKYRECDCMECWEEGYTAAKEKFNPNIWTTRMIVANWAVAFVIGFIIGVIL